MGITLERCYLGGLTSNISSHGQWRTLLTEKMLAMIFHRQQEGVEKLLSVLGRNDRTFMTPDVPLINQGCAILFIDPDGIRENWLSPSCYVSFSRGTNYYSNINQYHYISQRDEENQLPNFMGHLLRYPSTGRTTHRGWYYTSGLFQRSNCLW